MTDALPKEWSFVALGDVLKERKERGVEELPLLAVTGKDGVVPRDGLERRDTSNADKSKYLVVRKGDIAYNTMRMWQGVSGVSSHEGIVSPAYTICRVQEGSDSAFLGHLLKLPSLVTKFRRRSQGLVSDTWNLKYQAFSEIRVQVPPLSEQVRIAEILGSVDDVIEQTRAQIAKLQDLKTATMNELLTKGIGHTEFKDTEVGPIPKSWRIERVREFLVPGSESGRVGLPIYSVLIEGGMVKRDSVDRRLISELEEESNRYAPADSFVYNTMRMWQGASGVAPEDCWVSPAYVVSIPTDLVEPQFVALLMKQEANVAKLVSASQGITKDRLRLYYRDFAQIPFALPPIAEQKRIVEILESINQQIVAQKTSLQLEEDLKRSLMQDLLTGKVRVGV